MAWLPKEKQSWNSAVCAQWTEVHKRSCLTALWDMNLILNNHHALSHTVYSISKEEWCCSKDSQARTENKTLQCPWQGLAVMTLYSDSRSQNSSAELKTISSLNGNLSTEYLQSNGKLGVRRGKTLLISAKEVGIFAWQCGNTAVQPPEIR